MSGGTFLVALVVGAAALALWLHVRFPGLAPKSLRRRGFAAVAAFLLVGVVPVAATALSLLGVFLPVLVFSFLTALWLLQVLADPASHL
jgi:hypothetical protein